MADWFDGPPEPGMVVWVAFAPDGRPVAVWRKLAEALDDLASKWADQPPALWGCEVVKPTEQPQTGVSKDVGA